MASYPTPGHPPPPHSPTLTSLPTEILARIVVHLDRPTALSFARVSRTCTPPADHRIWRDLDLFLNTHHGELVLESPQLESRRQREGWRNAEGRAAEARHRLAIKQKISAILDAGDQRRWSMVRKVTVVPKGTESDIMKLLGCASRTLTALHIHPYPCATEKHKHDEGPESLCRTLFTSSLRFLALTHLKICPCPLGLAISEDIMTVFDIAPNLISLDFAVADFLAATNGGSYLAPTTPKRNTDIEALRIVLRTGRNPSANNCARLLQHCPRTQQLSMLHENEEGLHVIALSPVARAIREYAHLRDLYWEAVPRYREYDRLQVIGIDQPDEGYQRLRRLMIKSDMWMTVFTNLQSVLFPALEVLFIDPSYDPHYPHSNNQAVSFRRGLHRELVRDGPLTFPRRIDYTFAAQLRRCPRLHVIQHVNDLSPGGAALWDELDTIEAEDEITGHVWSIRHSSDERELLHLHIREPPLPLNPFARRRVLAWVDYTDFDGVAVPLNIIQEMKDVEGAGVMDWDRRGVQVGGAAWKVLTTWHELEVVAEGG